MAQDDTSYLDRMVQQRRTGYLDEQALLRSINRQRMLAGQPPAGSLDEAIGGGVRPVNQTDVPPLQWKPRGGGGPTTTELKMASDSTLANALGSGGGGTIKQLLDAIRKAQQPQQPGAPAPATPAAPGPGPVASYAPPAPGAIERYNLPPIPAPPGTAGPGGAQLTHMMTRGRTLTQPQGAVGPYPSIAPGTNLDQVNARFRQAATEYARQYSADPNGRYSIMFTSGYRPGDPRLHGRGEALDMQLVEKGYNGQPLPNYQVRNRPDIAAAYQGAANGFKQYLDQYYPDLAKDARWGAYFAHGRKGYGEFDLMHWDLGGRHGLGMLGGDWEHGFTQEQARKWGIYSGGGIGSARPAPSPQPQAQAPAPTQAAQAQAQAAPDQAMSAQVQAAPQKLTGVAAAHRALDMRLSDFMRQYSRDPNAQLGNLGDKTLREVMQMPIRDVVRQTAPGQAGLIPPGMGNMTLPEAMEHPLVGGFIAPTAKGWFANIGASQDDFLRAIKEPPPRPAAPVQATPQAAPGPQGVNQSLLNRVAAIEDFEPKAKWDGHQYSNGWGTRAASPTEVIDQATGQQRLAAELAQAQQHVDRIAPNAPPNVRDALTSFTYNVGQRWTTEPGNRVAAAVRAGNYPQAATDMQAYVNQNGRQLGGLVKRRAIEAQMMTQPQQVPTPQPRPDQAPKQPVLTPEALMKRAQEILAGEQAQHLDQPTPGLIERGNIDLNNRPVVRNADGTVSTVRSIGANIDGQEVLLPTVSPDGRILTNEEAIDLYRKSGQHLGKFATPQASTQYAEQLHRDQEKQYAPGSMTPDIGKAAVQATQAPQETPAQPPAPPPQPPAQLPQAGLRGALWGATRSDQPQAPQAPEMPSPPTLQPPQPVQQWVAPPPQVPQQQPFGMGNLTPIPWDWMTGWGWAAPSAAPAWGGGIDTSGFGGEGFSGFGGDW